MAKAWRISVDGFDDAITHADSRRKAKYRAWKGSQDAGYRHSFAEIRVTRAKEYDDFRYAGQELDVCIPEDLVKSQVVTL